MYRIRNITKLNPNIRGARSVFIEIGGQLAKIRSRKEVVISDKEYRANKKMISYSANPEDWDNNIRFLVIEAPKKEKSKKKAAKKKEKSKKKAAKKIVPEPEPPKEKPQKPVPEPKIENKPADADIITSVGGAGEVATKPIDVPGPPDETETPPPEPLIESGDIKPPDEPEPLIESGDIKPPDESEYPVVAGKYDKNTLMEKTHKELDALIEEEGLKLEYSRVNPNKQEKISKFLAALQ